MDGMSQILPIFISIPWLVSGGCCIVPRCFLNRLLSCVAHLHPQLEIHNPNLTILPHIFQFLCRIGCPLVTRSASGSGWVSARYDEYIVVTVWGHRQCAFVFFILLTFKLLTVVKTPFCTVSDYCLVTICPGWLKNELLTAKILTFNGWNVSKSWECSHGLTLE